VQHAAHATSRLETRIIQAIDSVVQDRVLVFGRLPPHGSDLDLLARPADYARVAALLIASGYHAAGLRWAFFEGCSAFCVELVPSSAWNLSPSELEALFAEATPIVGARMLVAPSPHHAVLIRARNVGGAGGVVDETTRAQVAAALAEDPRLWHAAQERANAWRARWALELLRGALEGRVSSSPFARLRATAELALGTAATRHGRANLVRVARRRLRPGPVVALSGLDGAGKSFQANMLRETLGKVGLNAVVIWPPAHNVLFRTPRGLKTLLFGLLERMGRTTGIQSATLASDERGRHIAPVPQQNALLTQVFATVVVLAHAASFRVGARGHLRRNVLIYDRYALDSAVYVRHRWGHGRRLPFQCALVRRLSRTPTCSYFLEVAPQTAFNRKGDFPLEDLERRAALYQEEYNRFSVSRIDGERSAEELCAEIAADVWRRVG
jgi:thymidylate kinase